LDGVTSPALLHHAASYLWMLLKERFRLGYKFWCDRIVIMRKYLIDLETLSLQRKEEKSTSGFSRLPVSGSPRFLV
jgi:hypothetical protein